MNEIQIWIQYKCLQFMESNNNYQKLKKQSNLGCLIQITKKNNKNLTKKNKLSQ